MRVVVVGSGNVAWGLCAALAGAGSPPVQVFARNAGAGEEIARMCGCPYTGDARELAAADLYLIAVADRAIAEVAAELDFGEAVVAHTAGSVPSEALDGVVPNPAVCYPLQTFTRGRVVDLRRVPFFIEGRGRALETVRRFAERLSECVAEADSRQRAVLHAAAVFASNFTNCMYRAAEDMAAKAGFGFGVLEPLILETAAKAADAGSARDTQTGPASRGDAETMERHRRILAGEPGLLKVYDEISELIWETSRKT